MTLLGHRAALLMAVLAVLAAALLSSASPQATTRQSGGATSSRKNQVFSYYYYAETGIRPWDQPGNQITHVIFSFANILKDGTVTLQGPPHTPAGTNNVFQATERSWGYLDNRRCNCEGACLKGELWQLYLFKQRYPHIKTIMSVGGWTWSDNFSDVFASSTTRRRAAETSAELLRRYGFDGLDIDFEFPGAKKEGFPYLFWTSRPGQDVRNMASFFEETRSYFNSLGKRDWTLSLATSGVLFEGTPDDWRRLAIALDYLLVMAYEYQHNHAHTWPGAALNSVTTDMDTERKNTISFGINQYRAYFENDKIVVGIPIYGNGYSKLPANAPSRDNIPGFGIPRSTSVVIPEPTAYNVLMNKFKTEKGWISTYDPRRVTNVWYNGTEVWFLDSPATVKAKAQWVKDNGYGGVMLWNSNQDMSDPENSLINAIHQVYPVDIENGRRASSFCIPADQAEYCNLACGYQHPAGVSTSPPGSMNMTRLRDGVGGLADVFAVPSNLQSKSGVDSVTAGVWTVALVALGVVVTAML